MQLRAGSQTIIWAHFYFQEKVLEREALEWNNQMGLPCPMFLFLYISLSFLKQMLLVACVSSVVIHFPNFGPNFIK